MQTALVTKRLARQIVPSLPRKVWAVSAISARAGGKPDCPARRACRADKTQPCRAARDGPI
jgi:hypothetical protein